MDTTVVYEYPLQKNEKSFQKMSTPPLIFPRSHDQEVWGMPSGRHSNINTGNMRFDLSQEYSQVPQINDYDEYDPRVSTYTKFSLDKLGDVCDARNGNGVQQSTPLTTQLRRPIQVQNGNQGQRQMNQNQMSSRENYAPIQNNRRDPRFSEAQPQQPVVFSDSYDTNYPETSYPLVTFPRYVGQNQTVIDIAPKNLNNTRSIAGPTQDWFNSDSQPPSDLLIPRTIDSIYGPGAVSNEERIKYLQNIQPDSMTLSDVSQPINANMGISYNPDMAPLVLDQVAGPYSGTTPLYHRIDPQLVRDQNIDPRRLAEMPRRTNWSSRYNTFDAQPGTVGFDDIYDPRFNGYGDAYRAYSDVNLGQVNYFYGDTEAYRVPNFTDRSKVDFIDFITPQGKVLPEYRRQVGVDDIKQTVNSQWMADSTYFRDDITEKLMMKRNSEMWGLRSMPLRKNANSSGFTSNY
jgi:hypothetical protein